LNVLIIGAGPVGLTLAIELTRYGVPMRIIERAAHSTDKSKAIVLWSRTLDANGNSVQSPYPYALMLPQSETERLLEAACRTPST
jgi:glycine/D-amino acid oxidase-like deaminating enzyme